VPTQEQDGTSFKFQPTTPTPSATMTKCKTNQSIII